MSGAPSPFRFITPRRRPPQQQQHGGSRLRFVTPGKQGLQREDDGGDGRTETPVLGTGRGMLHGPRAFLTPAYGRTETVEGDSDDGDDGGDDGGGDGGGDGEDNDGRGGGGGGSGGGISRGGGRGLAIRRNVVWDVVEDGLDSSPVTKRRKVEAGVGIGTGILDMSREGEGEGGEAGDEGGVIEDIEVYASDEEGGGKSREEGREGDADAGSGIEVVLRDFIKRGAVLPRDGDRDGDGEGGGRDEEDNGVLRSSPTPAALSKSKVNLQTPARPTSSTNRFLPPAPAATESLISTCTPTFSPTAPAPTTRKPPRFRISTPALPSAASSHPTTNPSTLATPATTTKPTKPASAYFRTIRPPQYQTNNQSTTSADLPLGLAIPSDWSPDKNFRRRAKAGGVGGSRLKGSSARGGGGGGGGKFVEGGLASQVLGWTLEVLSLSGSGGIFEYAGRSSSGRSNGGRELGGELERWRRVEVLSVAGKGEDGKGGSGLEGNLALGGVVVKGEETYGGRTEGRRYLLVTGRGAGGGMGSRGLEMLGREGGVVRYRDPWWDLRLGGDEEGGRGEEYRVLCAWDVGSGSNGEEGGGGSGE